MDKDKFNISLSELNYRLQEGLDKHNEEIKKNKDKFFSQYEEIKKPST